MFEVIKILLGIILFIISLFFPNKILFITTYVIIAYPLFTNLIKSIRKKDFIDENLLMIIATVGAMIIGNFHEALVVVILYQIGELLSDFSTDKSRKNILSLLDMKEEVVHLYDKDVNPSEVKVGDIIYVKTGEKIPLDGILKSGRASLDMKSLTGESKPKIINEGEEILSGSINLDGYLEIKVIRKLEESTSTKMMKLIEEASNVKSKNEKFITKFAKVYTPIVVLSAVSITLIPFILKMNINEWIYRSLVFLVISCPCALVISVPLGYFCAIGKCSRLGILVKGSEYLDELAKVDTVVLDKTGTITKGNFAVDKIIPYKVEMDELIYYASYAEYNSNHPIAVVIKDLYKEKIDKKNITEYEEISGFGVKTNIGKDEILVGNYKLLDKYNIAYPKVEFLGSTVLIAKNNEYIGTIVINDSIKDSCINIVDDLKQAGFKNVIMLSGDSEETVAKIASKLKFDHAYGSLLPNEKVEVLESLNKISKTLFIGDGINDSLVILKSNVGVSMGSIGSDAAIEASDIVLLNDDPTKIIDAYKIAKIIKKIVSFNIIFSITVKIICLLLSLFGITNMWIAILSDVGVTIITVINSIRIYKKKYN